jgi:glycosyltransferase involved in cell wall biosynthesis
MNKILIVADTRGWAYDIIAKNIVKFSKKFIYTLVYEEDIINKKIILDFDNFDLIFWFYWGNIHKIGPNNIKNFNNKKICVGIHSYNSWQKRNMSASDVLKFCDKYLAIGVPSIALKKDLKSDKVFLTQTGYDPDIFLKTKKLDFNNVFLWSGNTSKDNHGDIKGYHDIIMPAFEGLKNLQLLTQTKDLYIKNEDMPLFYNKGSVLICASKTEGGPMPVLEALACGIPVISTRVGWSQYIIKDGYNGFLFDRTKEDLIQKINKIQKINFEQLSKNAVKSVEDYSWKKTILSYDKFFEHCLDIIKK